MSQAEMPIGTDHAAAANWGAAADRAYDAILGLILNGEVASGERLREQVLAEAAGVSRTPVRQALNRLAAEGVVRLSRHKGAEVVSLTDEETVAVLEVRARFEPYAASLAVPRLSSDDLDHLTEINGRMRSLAVSEEARPLELGRLNNEFHAVFVHRCGNHRLASAINSFLIPAMVVRTFGRYSSKALHRSLQHHEELVDSARAGDAAWTESVMRTHILAARHAYSQPVGGP